MNDLPKFEDFLKQSLIGNKFTMYIFDEKDMYILSQENPLVNVKRKLMLW